MGIGEAGATGMGSITGGRGDGAARAEGGTPVIPVAPVGRWIVEGTVTRTDDPVLVGSVGLVGLVGLGVSVVLASHGRSHLPVREELGSWMHGDGEWQTPSISLDGF